MKIKRILKNMAITVVIVICLIAVILTASLYPHAFWSMFVVGAIYWIVHDWTAEQDAITALWAEKRNPK